MIAWASYEVGDHRIPCPACGRSDRDNTLGLIIEADGKGVAHCCGASGFFGHRFGVKRVFQTGVVHVEES